MAAVRRALDLCLKHRTLLLRGRGAGPARGEAVDFAFQLQEVYGETITTETRTATKQSDPYFATSADARAIWPKIVAQQNTSWPSIRRQKRRGRRSRNRFATGADVHAIGLAIVAQQNTWSTCTKRIERPSVPQDFFRNNVQCFWRFISNLSGILYLGIKIAISKWCLYNIHRKISCMLPSYLLH